MSNIIISNILKNLHHIKKFAEKENIYLAMIILILFSFDNFQKSSYQ